MTCDLCGGIMVLIKEDDDSYMFECLDCEDIVIIKKSEIGDDKNIN